MTPTSSLSRLLLVLSSAALSLLLGGLLQGCGDDTEDTDTSLDTGDVGAQDTTHGDNDTDSSTDTGELEFDADTDADSQADADAGPQEFPPCPEGRRRVGELCRYNYDRSCLEDANCREGEQCIWSETDNPELPGTCIYTPAPMLVCPGGPGCESGEGVFRAGFSKRIITPIGWEVGRPGYSTGNNFWGMPTRFNGDPEDPATFCDCGRDMICPPTEEYADCPSFGEWTGPDEDGTEGDGLMQGAWLAGFDNSRNAALCPDDWLIENGCEGPHCCINRFTHDEMWARTVVLDQGDTRIAWVSIDTVGYFFSEVQAIHEALDPALGIDWVVVSASHTHNAPDTLGQWGPGALGADLPVLTGAYPSWMADVRAQIAGSIEDAVDALEEAQVYVGHVNSGPIGFAARDTRDPFIFDDRLSVIAFVRAGGEMGDPDATLGTILNWHAHPEAVSGSNTIISSDFPHWVREGVEQGFATAGVEGFPAREGVGGIAMYVSGSVGGLINPLHREAIGRDGVGHSANRWEKAQALGERLADIALLTLSTPCENPGDQACYVALEDFSLNFATRELIVDVSNANFHVAIMNLNLFTRPLFNWRIGDGVMPGDNLPKGLTSVTQIRLGDVAIQTFPGEPFPELTVGYHPDDIVRDPIIGDWMDMNCGPDYRTRLAEDDPGERFGCLVRASNPNPPNLDAVPRGAPLATRIGTNYLLVIGLGNDELGYLVPSYDFKTELRGLLRSPGDHYEETVSPGDVVEQVLDAIYEINDELMP